MAKAGRPVGAKQGQAPHFSKAEIKVLLAVAKAGKRNGVRNHAFLQVCFSSALRVAEPLAFTRKMVEAADGSIVEVLSLPKANSKNGKARLVFLNKSARAALKEYLALLPTAPETKLFSFSANYASWLVSKICTEANLPNHSAHSIRRSVLTLAIDEMGLTLPQVQQLADHATPQQTLAYLRKDPKPIAEKLRNISF